MERHRGDCSQGYGWEKAWGQIKGGGEFGSVSHRKGELLLFSEQSEEKESGSKTESGLRRREDGGELSCYREGRRIEEVVRMGREGPSR